MRLYEAHHAEFLTVGVAVRIAEGERYGGRQEPMLSDGAMRSLALVRYLHAQAIEQERKGDLLAGLALLPLHDAIELFLRAAAGEKDVPLGANEAFLAYWSAFERAGFPLPSKTQMDCFNRARVEVKHRGALHAQHVVAQHRRMVTEFLERTSPQLFGVEFDEISLSGLVRSRDVRACLQDAEKALTRQDLEAAVLNSARAFRRALRDFRFGDPPKSVERRLVDPTSLDNLRMGEMRLPGVALDSHFVRRIGEAFEQMNEAMTVVAYNLDYDGYRHLLTFGPVLHEMPGHEPTVDWMFTIMPDQNAAARCIAFAIDAALRLENAADLQAL